VRSFQKVFTIKGHISVVGSVEMSSALSECLLALLSEDELLLLLDFLDLLSSSLLSVVSSAVTLSSARSLPEADLNEEKKLLLRSLLPS